MFRERIHSLWNPECYHGWGKNEKFFEGWYYKIVSENQEHKLAIIPGIAMDKKGNKQAFIQVLDGKNLEASYHKFLADDFKPKPRKHNLSIKKNRFTENSIEIDLPNLKGKLQFKQRNPWSSSILSPNIMGPFSFVPFMECYHGILSMDHEIEGTLEYKNKKLSFDNGRGYTEKDWGHSFPEGYVWMQSNHFSKPGVSIKASIAKIPWLGSSFIGHIAGVLIDGKLIEFTTYNGTKLKKCSISSKEVYLEMENKKHSLYILAKREEATSLAAPIAGFMDARIEESMNAQIEVKLTNKKSNIVLLEDTGFSAGLEVAGNFKVLLK
ncbi:MAG: tocopherol cyclase family protein [Flavobacteriaceae bacterium]|nr:tocopherol cyclase family protein [Flavobacteriaceae bacterium]